MADSDVPAEEKLRKLEEQTKQWKEAVVTQLNEAANKNKLLRDELRVVRSEKDVAVAEVRVQLSQEFKERTAMLREETEKLHAQVAKLREDNHQLAVQHEEELAATEQRVTALQQAEAAAARLREAEEMKKVEADLRAQLDKKEKALQEAGHGEEVLRDRLQRVTAQYQELSELLRQQDGKGADGSGSAKGGGGGGADGAASDAAHQHQLERVKAELASKALDTQRQLQEADKRYQAEREAVRQEMQHREDQLAVVQALLRQSQTDLSALQRRLSHSETEKQSTERHFSAKVASLSKELAAALDGAREAHQHEAELRAQVEGLQAHIHGLEEEAESREAAFRTLMLSEDQKTLVHELREALQESTDQAENWKAKYYSTLETTPSPFRRRADSVPNDDATTTAVEVEEGDSPAPGYHGGGGGRWDEQRSQELQAREEAVAAQMAELAHKTTLLQAAEAKLSETKRQVAEQANLLLQQQHQQKPQQQQQQAGRHGGTWKDSPAPQDAAPSMMAGLEGHVPLLCRVSARRLLAKPRMLMVAGLIFIVVIMMLMSAQA